MAGSIQSSIDPNGSCHTTTDPGGDELQGFVKISVRGQLFEISKRTLWRSEYWRQIITYSQALEDGYYHIERDPEVFKCLINYLIENRVRSTLPCSVAELYHEAEFYGIKLPENDCWGTVLSYTLARIRTYNIRAQIKSFADRHNIFGWVSWRGRILVDIEFHCHRTFDLTIISQYILEKLMENIFSIQSSSRRDIREQISVRFECPRTEKQDRSSKSLPETPSATPSSSESCPESAKDLIKQLSIQDVRIWVQQTMFHREAERWFAMNVNGKELFQMGKTGRLTNGTVMLSGYDLVRFKDVLNRLGFELELE